MYGKNRNFVKNMKFSYDFLRGTSKYEWGMRLDLYIAQVHSTWGRGVVLLCHEVYGLFMQYMYVY